MKRIFILFSFVFIGLSLTAQDVHFSQYYASPLTLNPALTGKFNGLYRVTAIYRDQWRNIQQQKSNTFMTPSLSVDFSLLKDKLKNSALGVGAVVTYDKVGAFNTIDVGANVAYHLGLDKKGKVHIALGFQGLYSNRRLDPDFKFEDEIVGNLTTSPDDNLNTDAKHVFDLGAGMLVDAQIGKATTLYGGYSANHILTPKDDFIDNPTGASDYKTPLRHVVHVGAEIEIKKTMIIPGLLFQTTANTNEINFGVTAGYKIIEKPKKNTSVFLGAWYRLNEGGALIAKAGIDFENFRITGAYDIGLAGMGKDSKSATNVNRLPSAFEIGISYFGQGKKPTPANTYLFNPRF
ncbi:MAG: PorP/SprF family type IX secretion system membrane protein [Chitinophagales bacterium]